MRIQMLNIQMHIQMHLLTNLLHMQTMHLPCFHLESLKSQQSEKHNISTLNVTVCHAHTF